MTLRSISTAERRIRLGARHLLARPLTDELHGAAATIERVVDDLVVLHATDPATLYLSIQARLDGVTVDAIDDALFGRRSILRTLAMRRTLFVATGRGIGAVEGSSSVDVAARERRQLEKALVDAGIDQPAEWLATLAEEVEEVLGDGSMPARKLSEAVPALRTRIVIGSGRHTAEVNATSRVLLVMAAEGRLARGRPTGGWTDRQYQWMRRDRAPLPDPDVAAAELVARWLARFGPGTMTDLKWWTGWTMTKTRKALTALGDSVCEVDLDGAPGIDLADPGEVAIADQSLPTPSGDGPAWVAMLPSLDATPMGWKERGWYLCGHDADLFDRNGNIGPTIWLDGRIVGGWAQTPAGDIATELFEDLGTDVDGLVAERAAAVARFVGDSRFKPSFPTPVQRRLAER